MEHALIGDTPGWVQAILNSRVTDLLTRLLLTLPFWWSGLAKLTQWSDAIAEVTNLGFASPIAVAAATILVQLGGSLLIVANRYVWLGAGALGVFTLIATLVAHPFWRTEGSERVDQMMVFLEHMSLVAGFVLVAMLSARRQDVSH